MKQHLKALGIVLILAAVLVWGFNFFFMPKVQQASTSATNLTDMEKNGVPSFSFKQLNGESLELSQLKGHVVIVNFWASWCGPCVEEVPSLIKLVKEFKGDVQLLAISGDSSLEDINVFMKSFPELKNENIKIVWDQDRSLMKKFDIERLPESLILAQDQHLLKKISGSINWYTPESLSYLKDLLKK